MNALRASLGAILFFAALNAFGGGIYGLAGAKDVPLEWLEGSPFGDYTIPSLILFLVVGGVCLAASIVVVLGSRGRGAAAAAGVVLLGWIVVQVLIIGFVSWMQPVTFVAGAIILAVAPFLPDGPPARRVHQGRA